MSSCDKCQETFFNTKINNNKYKKKKAKPFPKKGFPGFWEQCSCSLKEKRGQAKLISKNQHQNKTVKN